MRSIGFIAVAFGSWLSMGCLDQARDIDLLQVGEIATDSPSSTGSSNEPNAGSSALPFCQGLPTTFVEIVANFDATAPVPTLPWDVTDPSNTSNFSTTLTIYNTAGMGETLEVYFRRSAERIVDYHVLAGVEGSAREYGTGQLEFNGDGSLARWIQIQPLVLPALDGSPGQRIALNFGTSTQRGGSGLDGITSREFPSNVSYQSADGRRGVIGYSCDETARVSVRRESFPPDRILEAAPAEGEALDSGCGTQATTRIFLRGNLWTNSPNLAPPWSPLSPDETSNFNYRDAAVDAAGRVADLEFRFRRETERSWSYHVLVESSARDIDVGSGYLDFDERGRLSSSLALQAVRLPQPDGTSVGPIALDFGRSLSEGGNGIDGLTAMNTASQIYQTIQDGEPGSILQPCELRPSSIPRTFEDPWQPPRPGCVVQRTNSILIVAQVNELLPIADGDWTASHPPESSITSDVQVIHDSQGLPHQARLYLSHVSPLEWDYHLLLDEDTDAKAIASGRLGFESNGPLIWVDGPKFIRSPFPTDADGPPIDLDFGLPTNGVFRSTPHSFNWTWVSPTAHLENDGMAAEASGNGCATQAN